MKREEEEKHWVGGESDQIQSGQWGVLKQEFSISLAGVAQLAEPHLVH